MAGGAASTKTIPSTSRKRVEAETSLKRARDGSAFTRCEECNKDVPVVLIDMHNCSLDSKIKMNLEAQVIEKAAEAKKSEKAKAVRSEPKAKKMKKTKDPNMPKRPQTAFFLFMVDFRKEFKESHPDNKSVAVVGKEGGEKWKSLSDEEKKVYLDKHAELKAEYEEVMAKYNANDNEVEEGPEKEEEGPEKEDE